MGKRPPRKSVLAGGGATTPGVIPMPSALSRGQVEELRFQTNQNTVGDALTERMAGLNTPANVNDMAAVLSRVMRESQAGDQTAANTYGRALQQLLVQRPDIWNKLLDATTDHPDPEVRAQNRSNWSAAFQRQLHDDVSPTRGVGLLSETPSNEMAIAENFPATAGGEVNMGRLEDMAYGSDVSAVPAPALDRQEVTADQFPFTKAMFFGGSERAKNMQYDKRPRSAAREMMGPLRDYEINRIIAQESGLPLETARPGMEIRPSDVHPNIIAAQKLVSEELARNRSFNPQKKIGLRELLIDQARAQGIAETAIPHVVQAQLDNLPVARVAPEIGMAVRGLLSDVDPDELGRFLPYGDAIAPRGTVGDRRLINRERSALAKNAAAIEAATYGESPLPPRLDKTLNDPTASPLLRGLIEEGRDRGMILDLDRLAPWWRNETMIAPHLQDLGMYKGQLPPEILATLLRQSMLDNDPRQIARLIEPTRQSMNLLNQLEPSAANTRALYQWRRGKAGQPAPPPEPRIFTPNGLWAEAVRNFYQHHQVPMPPVQAKPRISEKNIPKLNQSGMLRLPANVGSTAYRTNPLTSLIG